MRMKLSEYVSVTVSFNHLTKKIEPRAVLWKGRIHHINSQGLHHTYREGRTLFHVFSVATSTLFFRLVLNTETLFWKLEEISDGLGD